MYEHLSMEQNSGDLEARMESWVYANHNIYQVIKKIYMHVLFCVTEEYCLGYI